MPLLWDKFWTRVDMAGGPQACWLWTARRHRQGYGWAWHCDDEYLAHRVAALLAGILPSLDHPAKVLHECDNPPCCNPSHLTLGTQSKNMLDAKARGRLAGLRCGGANGRAKLSDDQVRAIRSEAQSSRSLGRKYGVAKSTILRIISRRAYADVV